MDKINIPIFGVYFICCINNYLDVVKEQLDILDKGLLNISTNVIVFITKYDMTLCSELDKILNNYDKFILIKTSDNLYEKYAINNYKQYITEKEYYLYYFHTKGLGHINDPLYNVFSSRRQILNYYTLLQYSINIKLLDVYDAVGCSLHLYPKKHFSGNFWWSKSSYLQTLENINDKYLSPEMYILSNNNCKYISLANDTNNILINDYKFPDEITIERNKTTGFIVIHDHLKLMHLCE
jgi:hypothetical protein